MIKKITYLCFLLLAATSIKAQSITAGASTEYNLTTDAPGINLRGYYNIGEHICFGPELTFSFPETIVKENNIEDKFVFEVNLNAHYIFEIVEDKLGFYPLFGLNYTLENIDYTDLTTGVKKSENKNFFGLNLGAGFHILLNNFQPFIEYHYITGELGESVISAGLLYNFKKSQKESKVEEE